MLGERKNSATPSSSDPELVTMVMRVNDFHTCGGVMFWRLLSGITANGNALVAIETGASRAVAPRSAAAIAGLRQDGDEEQDGEYEHLLETGVDSVPSAVLPAISNPGPELPDARCNPNGEQHSEQAAESECGPAGEEVHGGHGRQAQPGRDQQGGRTDEPQAIPEGGDVRATFGDNDVTQRVLDEHDRRRDDDPYRHGMDARPGRPPTSLHRRRGSPAVRW